MWNLVLHTFFQMPVRHAEKLKKCDYEGIIYLFLTIDKEKK
jgi:hypothetical protein